MRGVVAALSVIALSSTGALALSAPASAAPVTYEINATYATGGTLTGTITWDAAVCAASATAPDCPEAYSNWNLVSSSGDVYSAFTYTPTTSEVLPTSNASAVAIAAPPGAMQPETSLNLFFNPTLAAPGSHSLAPFSLDGTDYVSLELHTAFLTDSPPDKAYRLISSGGITAASAGTLKVNARSAKKLANNKRTTVVKSAKVTPAADGKIKSITVRCAPKRQSRGDMRYCTYTKNKKSGKVTVTPLAGRGTTVKVTIKTKPKAGSTYEPETWKRTWTVK